MRVGGNGFRPDNLPLFLKSQIDEYMIKRKILSNGPPCHAVSQTLTTKPTHHPNPDPSLSPSQTNLSLSRSPDPPTRLWQPYTPPTGYPWSSSARPPLLFSSTPAVPPTPPSTIAGQRRGILAVRARGWLWLVRTRRPIALPPRRLRPRGGRCPGWPDVPCRVMRGL